MVNADRDDCAIRRQGSGDRTASREMPGSRLIVAADLARPEAPAEIMTTLTGRGIAIETLVNNAGVGLSGEFANSARVTFAAARSR
jgi:NADP-dependent 3-hydroxy acid dehydrogenase YdfG